tara:strand:+ start:590 stop:895 length:306 start_codon:yes stop_codon:yes gene_type:complete
MANTYASPVLVATFRLYCRNIGTPSLCCYTASSNFQGRSFNEAFGGMDESRRIAKNPNNQKQFLWLGLIRVIFVFLDPSLHVSFKVKKGLFHGKQISSALV